MVLRDLLIRAALDPDFRERVRREPDAALTGYDLTSDEREALHRCDASLLPHIARAALPPRTGGSVPPRPPLPPPPSEQRRLRLRPRAVRAGDTLSVGWTVTLVRPSERTAPAEPVDVGAQVAAVHEATPGEREAALRALLEVL